MADRRQRIHELVVALLAHQADLELLHEDGAAVGPNPAETGGQLGQAMKRSQRIIRQYQALVHSAVTLDALIDQELSGCPLGTSVGMAGTDATG
jgi:hypothetical protein